MCGGAASLPEGTRGENAETVGARAWPGLASRVNARFKAHFFGCSSSRPRLRQRPRLVRFASVRLAVIDVSGQKKSLAGSAALSRPLEADKSGCEHSGICIRRWRSGAEAIREWLC